MTNSDQIKAVILDVDGTLYRSQPSIETILRDYWIDQVKQHKRISLEEAELVFEKGKEQYKSSTRVLEVLGLGDSYSISKQIEKLLAKSFRKYLKKDRKLVELVKKLRGVYSLHTLRNGTKNGTKLLLSQLGFENQRKMARPGFGPFNTILPTAELGVMKPNLLPFKNAIKVIGCSPSEIIMVGDRVEVDLIPAKKIGMKTVWVSWGKPGVSKEEGVDAVIETIYDMRELL